MRGTGFSVDWGAFAGLVVKGVDTNRIHAIEVHYLETHEKVLVSGGGSSTDERPDPVDDALWHTVFPPPWPDRSVGDVDDPTRYPPPILHDVGEQVQVQHGGSDVGTDVNAGGRPQKPGSPGKNPNGG